VTLQKKQQQQQKQPHSNSVMETIESISKRLSLSASACNSFSLVCEMRICRFADYYLSSTDSTDHQLPCYMCRCCNLWLRLSAQETSIITHGSLFLQPTLSTKEDFKNLYQVVGESMVW
jgi:hypothetical protein